MKKMLAIMLMMMVFIRAGESQTCQTDNCDKIISTIRMIDNLKQKFENIKSEEENYKKDHEALVQELQANWTKFNQESLEQKILLKKVHETMGKLNSSGGLPGPQGEKGDQGEKGEQGMKGENGDEGQKGETGGNGTSGDTGAAGLKGDMGQTGPKGDQGPTGPTCCPDIADTDPCISSPCQNGGICEVASEGYKCTCPPWRTGSLCESAQTLFCHKVAECAAGVSYVNDLHEETPDTVLVSGHTGIARCNVTGGSGQLIETPEGATGVYSTILTDAGELWTSASFPGESGQFLYRRNTDNLWQKAIGDQFTGKLRLEINNGLLTVLDMDEQSIKSLKIATQPSLEVTMDLKNATTFKDIMDFAELPSGAVVVIDQGAHCAHIIGQDGGLVTTLGTCDSSGSALGQLRVPLGVGVDMFANILISEISNGRISVFTSTGVPITTLCEGELQNPTSVLVTSGGYMAVGQFSGDVKIFRYSN